MSGQPGSVLSVTNVTKRYGQATAVAGVSFDVAPGRVFCLLGPNGAGKTTTLEMAQGIRRPTSGTVRVFGVDPMRAPRAVRARIGVLPQQFASFESLTVRENLRYFAEVYNVRPDIPALLGRLGLQEHEHDRVQALSGGTQRRVGILLALVGNPDLVFLDEPTAGVDPASRRQVWDIIRDLKADGRSIVLTTHYMDEAERLADDVAILRAGRIIARGTPERVRLDYGGGSVVRIRGLVGPLPPALAARPGLHLEAGGVVAIPLTASADGPLVVADLVRSGVEYEELSIREPTLDDAFVRLATRKVDA